MWDFILDNFSAIILAAIIFADAIVSMTPSKEDDKIVGYIRIIYNALAGKNKARK